jgi:hypothetical protein
MRLVTGFNPGLADGFDSGHEWMQVFLDAVESVNMLVNSNGTVRRVANSHAWGGLSR